MKTLIVTGMSGAGKSKAIDILEDAGFFCVDNVPAQLVRTFVDLCRSGDSEIDRLAVVTDIRGETFNKAFQEALIAFKNDNKNVDILFLEAEPAILVSRYQETRRMHPLAARAGSLSRSIELESQMLKPLRDDADYIIDTTALSTADLRKEINALLDEDKSDEPLHVNVSSFGFKYGMPIGADFVFDVRFLPNPFYKKELRDKTGNDAEVRDYVMSFDAAKMYFEKITDLIESVLPRYVDVNKEHVEIAFGCTGGQHRSVTFAYLTEKYFHAKGYPTSVSHRDITKDREAT